MGRPKKGAELKMRLEEYLASAELRPWQTHPITQEGVAAALRCSKVTLNKYSNEHDPAHFLDLNGMIARAAKRQRGNGVLSAVEVERKSLEQMLAARDEEIANLQHRIDELLAQRATLEYNAARHGIKTDQLYQVMPRPNRDASRAGTRAART